MQLAILCPYCTTYSRNLNDIIYNDLSDVTVEFCGTTDILIHIFKKFCLFNIVRTVFYYFLLFECPCVTKVFLITHCCKCGRNFIKSKDYIYAFRKYCFLLVVNGEITS